MPKEIAVSPIVTKIESFSITNVDTMEEAVALLSLANRELDRLTEDREKITKPMNDALKEVRARYKPAESRLEGGINVLRKLITNYQTLMTAQAQKKQQQIAKKAGRTMSMETAMVKIAAVSEPEQRVITASGSVSFRTVPTYAIEDITKVPYEYLVVDMAKVKKEPKPIPGIKYGSEQQPINRR